VRRVGRGRQPRHSGGRAPGLLFDPGDAGALAAAIERVLTHEALARDLGERARAEVDERYDLAALVALEIALLKQVASRRVRARARSG